MKEGITDRFRLKVFGSDTKIIKESSFKNLDPFQFSYIYNGPLIKVNNGDEIIVERGTQTADLFITIDYPSMLNLTIVGKLEGLQIVP